MDTVILAAGKGSRLNGLVAPYHKPLLVVNGMSLVAKAAHQGHSASWNTKMGGNVIVVAAPQNALALSEVLPDYVDMIVQRRPTGPGEALLLGLELGSTDEVLVLMADNLTPDEDVQKILDTPAGRNVVGTSLIPVDLCERFTRFRKHSNMWVEKVPVAADDVYMNTTEHGDRALIWLGPLKFTVHEIRTALQLYRSEKQDRGEELPIGPVLNGLPDVLHVEVSSVDIGLPEVLP